VRGRDLVLLSAVLVIGAFAVVDGLRGDEPRRSEPVTNPSPRTTPVPRAVPEAPDDYPRGALRGNLVLAQRENCRLRVLLLAGGFERILPPLTGCRFWVSPQGLAIAYASRGRAVFRDLAGNPGGDLGGFTNLSGPVIWSPNGGRAAWCTASGGGFDFDVVEHQLAPRALDRCPAGYTLDGEPAFVQGKRLVVNDRTILRAAGAISFVSWASDGSIAVVEGPHERLERWQGNRLVDAVEIPDRLGGEAPVISPDNCAALFQDVDEFWFEVIALDCFETERPDLLIFGDSTSVAWSLDGRWIAVAYSDRIGFHRVSDGEEIASWPARAAHIAWVAD
jgi:hypothetical protein